MSEEEQKDKELVIDPRKDFLAQCARDAQVNCTMLYADLHKSAKETCMCWGWECHRGWNEVLKNMSYELEALNIVYGKKHHCYIRADQIKEKFGTLRVYLDVIQIAPLAYRILSIPFKKLASAISDNISFNMKSVQVKPAYDEDTIRELTKDEFEESLKQKNKFSNVELVEQDDKFWEITHNHRYAIAKQVPSRFKALYHLGEGLNWLGLKLDFSHWFTPSKEDEVIRDFLGTKSEEIVRKAEDKCYNVCEICGYDIGNEYSPRCQTRGWVTYICEHCAKETYREYIKDNKIFRDGVFVKDIEDVKLKGATP